MWEFWKAVNTLEGGSELGPGYCEVNLKGVPGLQKGAQAPGTRAGPWATLEAQCSKERMTHSLLLVTTETSDSILFLNRSFTLLPALPTKSHSQLS